jgi:hypothetical protein
VAGKHHNPNIVLVFHVQSTEKNFHLKLNHFPVIQAD